MDHNAAKTTGQSLLMLEILGQKVKNREESFIKWGMAVFITQNGIALYNFKTKQAYILIFFK
jgi:hypothetical protein